MRRTLPCLFGEPTVLETLLTEALGHISSLDQKVSELVECSRIESLRLRDVERRQISVEESQRRIEARIGHLSTDFKQLASVHIVRPSSVRSNSTRRIDTSESYVSEPPDHPSDLARDAPSVDPSFSNRLADVTRQTDEVQRDFRILCKKLFIAKSAILSDFPPILEEFSSKSFNLLYRGSRDGFGATDFHKTCDGHSNTITIIQTTRDWTFGGYSPLAWESPEEGRDKRDASLRSFVFTLANPSNTKPRKFALQRDGKHCAIRCDRATGPVFGESDIVIGDKCNAEGGPDGGRNSVTSFGTSYMNDSGVPGGALLAGDEAFLVKELEVFEITN
jgi:hypothetical protein